MTLDGRFWPRHSLDMNELAQSQQTLVDELLVMAPSALAERLRRIADDLQLAYSANTLRGWRSDWGVWLAFCRQHGVAPLPTNVVVLRAFLLERAGQGRKRATLEHNLATLSMVHRLAQLPFPLDSMEGRLMWRGIKREHLTLRQRQAQGLTLDDIEKVLATLDAKAPRDARDAALLSVAYESMCRRSELVAMQLEHLSEEADGSGRLLLPSSKTDQEGAGALQYLSPTAMGRIRHWLALASITDGSVFRSTPKSNRPNRFENSLSGRDVARIFKRLAALAGLDSTLISGHSTRVGATQDLLADNFSGAEIMRQGRWKTERMIVRYGERLAAGRGAMAKMLHARERQQEVLRADLPTPGADSPKSG